MKWRFAAAGLSLAAAGLLVSCSAAPARSHAAATPTLHVGQQIDVHMTGAGAVRLPHSSFPSVLAPGVVSRDGATRIYRAARPGHAVLIPGGQPCLARRHMEVKEIPGSCPVMAVTAVP